MQYNYIPPQQRDKMLWLAVDFDDTIAKSNWSPENPHAIPGDPIQENIDELHRCVSLGWKIVIHTSRSWADYEIIEHWLGHHRVHFDKIVCGKLLAHRYVDDRNAQLGQPWI